jgi:hypothetical protein
LFLFRFHIVPVLVFLPFTWNTFSKI